MLREAHSARVQWFHTGYTIKTANRLRPARVAQDVASETEDVFMQGEDFYAILGVVSVTCSAAWFWVVLEQTTVLIQHLLTLSSFAGSRR